MRIIGYFWPDTDDALCEKCGLGMIRATVTRADGTPLDGTGPVAMQEGELGYDDNVRCDACGKRLVEPAPRPATFQETWEKRQAARRRAAVARAEARGRADAA